MPLTLKHYGKSFSANQKGATMPQKTHEEWCAEQGACVALKSPRGVNQLLFENGALLIETQVGNNISRDYRQPVDDRARLLNKLQYHTIRRNEIRAEGEQLKSALKGIVGADARPPVWTWNEAVLGPPLEIIKDDGIRALQAVSCLVQTESSIIAALQEALGINEPSAQERAEQAAQVQWAAREAVEKQWRAIEAVEL
jgi:hypothetical protein